jgi:hypothetical protein
LYQLPKILGPVIGLVGDSILENSNTEMQTRGSGPMDAPGRLLGYAENTSSEPDPLPCFSETIGLAKDGHRRIFDEPTNYNFVLSYNTSANNSLTQLWELSFPLLYKEPCNTNFSLGF